VCTKTPGSLGKGTLPNSLWDLCVHDLEVTVTTVSDLHVTLLSKQKTSCPAYLHGSVVTYPGRKNRMTCACLLAKERSMDEYTWPPKWSCAAQFLAKREGEKLHTELELQVRDEGIKYERESRNTVDLGDIEVPWKKESEARYGGLQRNPEKLTPSPISSYAK
jgi:hypothetical protein